MTSLERIIFQENSKISHKVLRMFYLLKHLSIKNSYLR